MGISIIQQDGIPGSSSSSGSESFSWSATTLAGSTLAVIGLIYSPANASLKLTGVTDDGGNTWQYATSASQDPPMLIVPSGGGDSFMLFGAWCLRAAASTAVTVHCNDAVNSCFYRAGAMELSGVLQAVSASATSGVSTPPYGTPVTLDDTGDLILAVCDDYSQTVILPTGPDFSGIAGSGASTTCGYLLSPGISGAFSVNYSSASPGSSDTWGTAALVLSPDAPPAAAPPPPGRLIRSRYRLPGQGRARASAGTRGTAVTGAAAAVTVQAPAGSVTAVTGTPGQAVRRPLPAPRRGSGHGTFTAASQPGNITGPAGQVAVTAPAGTVQALAATPGRTVRPHPGPPRRGTAHGTFLAAQVPGAVPGSAGLIAVSAPPGTVTAAASTAVACTPGRITLAAVTGTVTAVTGTAGHAVRSRTAMPPQRHPAQRRRGSAGAVLAGTPGTVSVRAIPGTVEAVTGTPGRAVRSTTRMPPRRGTSTRRHGTAGSVIQGRPGTVTVTGPAGGISAAVAGRAGTAAVTAPPGFVVLVPRRYTRWRIRKGFSRTEPRSHITAGNAGTVKVTAPGGTVTAVQMTIRSGNAAPGSMIPGQAVPGVPAG